MDVQHPEWGQLPEIPSPASYSETPLPAVGISPKVGEHSEEILRELGFAPAEVAALLAGGQVKGHSKL